MAERVVACAYRTAGNTFLVTFLDIDVYMSHIASCNTSCEKMRNKILFFVSYYEAFHPLPFLIPFRDFNPRE